MKEIMGYVGSFQASVENAYDEKMIKTMKDLYGSEEVQKAKSEGNMEKLYQIFFDAYSKIQNEYVNSDEYKSLENAQLGAVDKLQESLAPRYQDYGYRMGLAFNEGLASTEYMQKNTAERFASFFSTPKTGTTILEQHGTSRNKGFAWGLSFVPYDNFPAILHEGERVMTASENRRYSSGNSNSAVITITGNNFSVRNDSDIDAIASALADKIEEAKEGYYDG